MFSESIYREKMLDTLVTLLKMGQKQMFTITFR